MIDNQTPGQLGSYSQPCFKWILDITILGTTSACAFWIGGQPHQPLLQQWYHVLALMHAKCTLWVHSMCMQPLGVSCMYVAVGGCSCVVGVGWKLSAETMNSCPGISMHGSRSSQEYISSHDLYLPNSSLPNSLSFISAMLNETRLAVCSFCGPTNYSSRFCACWRMK